MRLTALALAAVLALSLSAAPAVAEDELPPTSQFFDEYDTNADGKVMADEFAGSSEVFKLLDKNGDGAISPDELGLPADYKPTPRAKQKPAGRDAPQGRRDGERAKRFEQFRKRLEAMDTNKDGRVSKEEWQGPEQAFARVDRNKDGFIDQKDRMQGDARRKGGKAGKAGKGGKGRNRKPGAKGGDGADADRMKERVKQHFGTLDKNGDGKLTADEVPNPQLLTMADADKDGSVTFKEFYGAMKQRMRQRGGDRKGKGAKGRGRGRLSAGMLRRWDRDSDGKVSADEFPGRDDLFARMDVDKDGFLTEADIEAAKARRDAAPKGDKPTTTPKRGTVIEQQDKDGDGKLNRAEFQGPNSTWRLLDRNGDGWITADELKPAPAK